MDEIATSSKEALDVDALIETDSEILELVRKDVSQEYIRFMSRVLMERRSMQSDGSTSVSDHLHRAGHLRGHRAGPRRPGSGGSGSSGEQSLRTCRAEGVFPRSA